MLLRIISLLENIQAQLLEARLQLVIIVGEASQSRNTRQSKIGRISFRRRLKLQHILHIAQMLIQ